MKLLISSILLFSLITSVRADGGDSYRYSVKIDLKSGSNITGYIYFGTFSPGFDPSKERFIDFINREFHFPISVFTEIKSISIDSAHQIDFSRNGSQVFINKNEIESIKLFTQIKYPADQRIILLSDDEYEIIVESPNSMESIYNEKYSENCVIYLMCWSEMINLKSVRDNAENRITETIKNGTPNEVDSLMENIKQELKSMKVLLFKQCNAM